MQSSDDFLDLFDDQFPELRDLPFSFLQPHQVADSETCPFAPLITPEIRITQTTSNNNINVDESGVFRYADAYPTTAAIMNDTNLVPLKPDNSRFSINDFNLNCSNINFLNAEQGFFYPSPLPFPESNAPSLSMPKYIEIDSENEVPPSLSFRRRQSPISLAAQTIDSSTLLFADQHSFLAAGNDYDHSGTALVTPRRNSSPPILSTSCLPAGGLVASPSAISATCTDEPIDGDQFCCVRDFTPGSEGKKRRRKGNKYGSVGTRKCFRCRKLKQVCDFINPNEDCRLCRDRGVPCTEKIFASESGGNSQKRRCLPGESIIDLDEIRRGDSSPMTSKAENQVAILEDLSLAMKQLTDRVEKCEQFQQKLHNDLGRMERKVARLSDHINSRGARNRGGQQNQAPGMDCNGDSQTGPTQRPDPMQQSLIQTSVPATPVRSMSGIGHVRARIFAVIFLRKVIFRGNIPIFEAVGWALSKMVPVGRQG